MLFRSLLDWRWHDTGVVDALVKRDDVTVHARSVFLQGLLAANDSTLWPKVPGTDAKTLVAWLARTARELGRESVADLALAYARAQDWIDGVVVGMETENQLETNLALCTRPALPREACKIIEETRPRVPAALLDPARWPKR